jgi:hypothetical protein
MAGRDFNGWNIFRILHPKLPSYRLIEVHEGGFVASLRRFLVHTSSIIGFLFPDNHTNSITMIQHKLCRKLDLAVTEQSNLMSKCSKPKLDFIKLPTSIFVGTST